MNDSPRLFGVHFRNARPVYDWARDPVKVDENGFPRDKIPRELSDNRDRYIAQSAATKGGFVPRIPRE